MYETRIEAQESMNELGELIASHFLRVSVVGSTNEIVGWRVVSETRSHSTSHPKPHTTDWHNMLRVKSVQGLFIGIQESLTWKLVKQIITNTICYFKL